LTWWPIAALALTPGLAHPQVSGSNLFEGQAGNYPASYANRGPSNRLDFYDQVNLAYGFGSVFAGLRFETNRNSQNEYPYAGISARFAEWNDAHYRVRVGNFYSILGRGLIQRAFELNGVVLDQRFPRSRYAPSRDIDGVLADADWGPVRTTLLTGAPSGGESSLAGEELGFVRNTGLASGGQIAARLRDARVGAAYLRTIAGLGQQELGSGFLAFDPARWLGVESLSLPIYGEYAQANGSFADWWSFQTDPQVPHALYAGANLLVGNLGLSAEWKDYGRFRLGVNDPPSLVREHSYVLLNRSTHVLVADREVGFQFEGTYRLPGWASLTANWSQADAANARRFEEHFFELRSDAAQDRTWEAGAFYDWGKDELISISDRRTAGLVSTVRIHGPWSASLDLERQAATRELAIGSESFEDLYLSGTVAFANLGSASVVWTRTTDPLDPSRVVPGSEPLHLVGGVIDGQLSPGHQAILFFGRRRGGLACTAGTCYEVQPFEGAELRIVSRF